MSDLLVTDVDTTLSQKITTTELMVMSAIRPHIYIQNSPPGDLRVDIYDAADAVLLKSSEQISIASIKTQAGITDAFFHGYIRFNVDWGIANATQVTIRLLGLNGYTATATDFVSWCKDFDLRRYTASYTPNTGFNSAFDLEVWEQNDNVRAL